MRPIFAALAFIFVIATAGPTWATENSGKLEAWQNQSGLWAASVQSPEAGYTEGRVVPLRFVASYPAGTVQTLRIQYDFASDSGGHFFDFLQSFNATESGVQLLSGIERPPQQRAPISWALPLDTSLAPPHQPFIQPPGRLTTYNISQLTFGSSYSLTAGVKEIVVTYRVAGTVGSGNRSVIIAYGGHLASELDWGSEGGATQFPGTSRKAFPGSG